MEVGKKAGPTPAQLERLTEVEAKLLDVALDECDPEAWTNQEKAEVRARELEADGLDKEAKLVRGQWKGERYWEKRNANLTIALITRIVTYRQRLEEARLAGGKGLGAADETRMADDMKEAERAVKKRLALVKRRAC